MDDDRPALTDPLRPPMGAATGAAALPAVVLAAGLVWPLIAVGRRALAWPAVHRVLADAVTWRIVWFTVWQAAASTVLTVIASAPLTYALARFRFRGRTAVLAAAGVPFVLPTVAVAVAFRATLPTRYQQSLPAILLAHVFFNVAVVVRTVVPAWQGLDERFEAAARTLGASRWRAAHTVAVPLLRGPILSAATMVYLFCFTSFGVIRLLGGARRTTLEVELYRQAVQRVDLAAASALGLVQLAAVLLVLAGWVRAERRMPPAVAGVDSAARPARGAERAFVVAAVGATGALLVWPLVRLAQRSFTVPGRGLSLAWYRALPASGAGTTRAVRPLASFATSMTTAATAASLATVTGVSAAVALAWWGRRRHRATQAGLVAAMVPLGASAVTVGLGLFVAYGHPPIDLRGSPLLVPLAHALVGLPFVTRAALSALNAIDHRYRQAAATLGSSRWRTFRTVDVPLARRAVLAGAGMAAAVSLGEFGATSFLARRTGRTVPLVIADLLGRPGAANVGQAQALAVLLAVASAAVFLIADRAGRPRR